MSTAVYDCIVVGAGSVGTPAAMALAERGLKVLLLDQFASAGQGSNKCAIGGIRARERGHLYRTGIALPREERVQISVFERSECYRHRHNRARDSRSGRFVGPW